MTPPIIIAAFGTRGRARTSYEQVDTHLKALFPDHDIRWAFTSRIVRKHLKSRGVNVSPPSDVVATLAKEGHPWVVVQSFHMICGHEFYRLVTDVRHVDCRVSVGHSLLCTPADHRAVARAMAPVFDKNDDEAILFVGHGTDHCIWATYSAFYLLLRKMYGKRAFGAMIETENPTQDSTIKEIRAAGFQRVRLVPFMLVAGIHFQKDLAGLEDSWKTACEDQKLAVSLETEGLTSHIPIIDIFGEHIRSALAAIPDSVPIEESNLAFSNATG